ncbi:MAG: PGF-CTERM sorting domain-containing protein, partial [Alphaproteobacteria bacterium]
MAKNFALIGLFAVVFFLSLSMIALAADDIEWVEKQSSAKLYWGDSVTVEDYIIKAEDFSDDSVFISISKDGEKLKAFPMTEGMEVEYNDEIKVCARDIDPNYETITKNGKKFNSSKTKNPYVELNVSVRGGPSLDIELETNKEKYDSKSTGDSEIRVSINIKNDG